MWKNARAARYYERRRHGKGRLSLAALGLTFASIAPWHAALAAEGAVFGGPTGGTDIRQAYSPSDPGFYGNIVGIYAFANGSYGDNGVRNPIVANTQIGVAAAGILYVYPIKPWGGTISTFVQQAYTVGGYVNLGTRSGHIYGANDLFTELLGYSRYIGPLFGEGKQDDLGKPKLPYGLTVKVAYSMIFPTGDYSTTAILPQGHNDVFFIPNFALTYLTQPNAIGDGIELSARVFADIATTNPTTDYHTGTVMDVDFAVTDRVGPYQFGLNGFYAKQVENDSEYNTLVAPNGKHLELFDLGPIIAYDIPGTRSTIKFKYQVPIVTSNSLSTQRAVVSYSFKF